MKALIKYYPMDKKIISDLDPINWANEGHELAITRVYSDIEENVKLSSDYIAKG